MTKMNPDVKAKWVAALRSGEYGQVKNELANESGFCCLGVLCEVALKDGVPLAVSLRPGYSEGELEESLFHKSYDGDDGELPQSVQEWAELGSANPELGHLSAAAWNDDEDYDFNQIADLIEEHL